MRRCGSSIRVHSSGGGVGHPPLAGERVARHLAAVADQTAEIGFVAQDAALPTIAVDQRRAGPGFPQRRFGAVAVEALGDLLGRQAVGVFGEDPEDHRRRRFVDLAHAVDVASLLVHHAAHHPVAEGADGDGVPGGGARPQPAPDLGLQVAQHQGVHRALEADVQFRHPALVGGVDLDAVMVEQLVQRGDVLQRP